LFLKRLQLTETIIEKNGFIKRRNGSRDIGSICCRFYGESDFGINPDVFPILGWRSFSLWSAVGSVTIGFDT
jgi:hypothetical protein